MKKYLHIVFLQVLLFAAMGSTGFAQQLPRIAHVTSDPSTCIPTWIYIQNTSGHTFTGKSDGTCFDNGSTGSGSYAILDGANTYTGGGAQDFSSAGVFTLADFGLSFTTNAGTVSHATGYGIHANSVTTTMQVEQNGVITDINFAYQTLLGTQHTDTNPAAIVRGDLLVVNSSTLWSNLAKGSANTALVMGANDPAWTALTLAGAQFANQGTTTTVLHGNAAGNPSWGAVSLSADVTGTLPATAVAPTPLPTPGTSITLAAPRGYGFCTGGACAVTLPVPAAGYEFCIRNSNNETNVITLNNIASIQYEATAHTSYYAANRKLVSGGAVTDQICLVGYDATHYAVMSFTGTWTDTAP